MLPVCENDIRNTGAIATASTIEGVVSRRGRNAVIPIATHQDNDKRRKRGDDAEVRVERRGQDARRGRVVA